MTVPDFWTWAPSKCLSFCQNTSKSEERVEFLHFPPTLFSSLFLQQSGRRSSGRSKKAYPFPAVRLSWKSRPLSLIQFLWFRITFRSSMNELQRNLVDRQRDLMGYPVWLRYLEELKPYLSFMTRLGWVHLWLLEFLIQPWWRSPRMPQSHSRDLPSCPPLPPHLWPESFCHPRCKHSPAHTNWLSAWAKPFPKGLC